MRFGLRVGLPQSSKTMQMNVVGKYAFSDVLASTWQFYWSFFRGLRCSKKRRLVYLDGIAWMVYDNCFSNKWLLDTKWYIVTGRFYALLWVGVYSGYWRKCSSAWLVVSPQSFVPRDWLKWNPRNVGTYLMFFFLQKYWCVFHHPRS